MGVMTTQWQQLVNELNAALNAADEAAARCRKPEPGTLSPPPEPLLRAMVHPAAVRHE
jgi:hypothetical protein